MTTLPQSAESERGLLSAWLAKPTEVAGLCAIRGVSPSWFMQPFCASLYAVLGALWTEGKDCAYPEIVERMRKADAWNEECPALMHEVRTISPIASAAGMFIDTLREKLMLRSLIQACQKIEGEAWGSQDAGALLGDATKAIGDISSLGATRECKSLAQHAADYYKSLIAAEGKDTQLYTGIQKLDEVSPVFPGDMPAISGERKAGKSILAVSVALRLAEKAPVLYFSLEDRITKLIRRIVANVSKVPLISHRNPTGGQEMQMGAAMTRMQKSNLMLHDDILDAAGIVGRTRQFKAQHPNLSAVFIDYLQLLRATRRKDETREQEVSANSRAFRMLGMETGAAIFIISQLNSGGDTRESKAIEMDITAMWRLVLVDNEPGVRFLEIPFQRDGDSGVGFQVAFLGDRATVEALSGYRD